MVNGLAVLGWGVGGIEAEACMLGQPLSMLLPEVIGFKLNGKLKEGVTATDLVLTVTQMLRKQGVVGKFVEFFGPGLDSSDRRGPRHHRQHGAGIWRDLRLLPGRRRDHRYLKDTGRKAERVALVAAYAKAQGMFRVKTTPDPVFTDALKLDLDTVVPSMAGPKRPQDRVALKDVKAGFAGAMDKEFGKAAEMKKRVPVEGRKHDLGHGDVVIAAITSCTNTSNPSVMIGAGLLARKAAARGLTAKPWVKTSLAPGSQVVAEYLEQSGLQKDLDKIGFNLVGFGCTTCIGNSGPLPEEISEADQQERHGRRGGAVRQPQFRRPRQCRRARQLSRLAAARRRLCDRRLDADRRRQRRRSASTRTARRSSSRTSGRPTRRSAASSPRTSPSRSSPRNTPTFSRATPTGARSRSRAA